MGFSRSALTELEELKYVVVYAIVNLAFFYSLTQHSHKSFIYNTVNNVMAKRGRKVSSAIRDNLIEILYVVNQSYGYDLYKMYKKIFLTLDHPFQN